MLANLRTAAVFGIEACPVHVEVDVSFGFPRFTMVGLPDASVRESRDRVRAAIRNSGFEFPAAVGPILTAEQLLHRTAEMIELHDLGFGIQSFPQRVMLLG